MLISRLCLGEDISHLNLGGNVVKRYNPVTNGATSKVGIHTYMLGQLMLDRIGDNLKRTRTVTVERGRRGE